MQYARSKVDYVIGDFIYMVPSDMNLRIGKVKNYNNKIQISSPSFKIRTNLKINLDGKKDEQDVKPKGEGIVKTKPNIEPNKERKQDVKPNIEFDKETKPDTNKITVMISCMPVMQRHLVMFYFCVNACILEKEVALEKKCFSLKMACLLSIFLSSFNR